MPMSIASRTAKSSARSSNRSATRKRIFARSSWCIRPHGPSSNARRAAATASPASSADAFAIVVMTSSVVGSLVVVVSPLAASRHWPSMSSWPAAIVLRWGMSRPIMDCSVDSADQVERDARAQALVIGEVDEQDPGGLDEEGRVQFAGIDHGAGQVGHQPAHDRLGLGIVPGDEEPGGLAADQWII